MSERARRSLPGSSSIARGETAPTRATSFAMFSSGKSACTIRPAARRTAPSAANENDEAQPPQQQRAEEGMCIDARTRASVCCFSRFHVSMPACCCRGVRAVMLVPGRRQRRRRRARLPPPVVSGGCMSSLCIPPGIVATDTSDISTTHPRSDGCRWTDSLKLHA